jgi:hypothetical protein
MTEEITYKITFNVLGSVLLLAFSLGVLQTTIGSALLMNYFSRLTNLYYYIKIMGWKFWPLMPAKRERCTSRISYSEHGTSMYFSYLH